jgi:hypothetical protein
MYSEPMTVHRRGMYRRYNTPRNHLILPYFNSPRINTSKNCSNFCISLIPMDFNPTKINTSGDKHLKSCRINTSGNKDLKSSRINTSKKRPGGGGRGYPTSYWRKIFTLSAGAAQPFCSASIMALKAGLGRRSASKGRGRLGRASGRWWRERVSQEYLSVKPQVRTAFTAG